MTSATKKFTVGASSEEFFLQFRDDKIVDKVVWTVRTTKNRDDISKMDLPNAKYICHLARQIAPARDWQIYRLAA